MLACLFNNKTSESWVWTLRDGCAQKVHVCARAFTVSTCPFILSLFPAAQKGLGDLKDKWGSPVGKVTGVSYGLLVRS